MDKPGEGPLASETGAAASSQVNHPQHYGGADNPYEHVKVAEALGWVQNAFIYNCTKYLWRYGKKDPTKILEDLEKAKWYLDREIRRLKGDIIQGRV